MHTALRTLQCHKSVYMHLDIIDLGAWKSRSENACLIYKCDLFWPACFDLQRLTCHVTSGNDPTIIWGQRSTHGHHLMMSMKGYELFIAHLIFPSWGGTLVACWDVLMRGLLVELWKLHSNRQNSMYIVVYSLYSLYCATTNEQWSSVDCELCRL